MNQQNSREPKYPCMAHLMTRGTFYDVGYNVGLNFSRPIKLYFAQSDNFRDQVLPFYDSQTGRDFYEQSLRICQDCFPKYVREIRGMADGAGVPFQHVFLENISSEVNVMLKIQEKPEEAKNIAAGCDKVRKEQERHHLQAIHQDTDQGDSRSESSTDPTSSATSFPDNFGCTDLIINRPDHQLMLHNEDGYPIVKPYGYLLSAEIEEDDLKEQFACFCYPGCLPGGAWGYNVHGLAISIDWLCPKQLVKKSPGRGFICRALLRARNVEEAVKVLQNDPNGVAYGFCANISTKEGRMASVEVAPGKPQGLVHVHDVIQQQDPDAPCHYYHFNAHKHLTEVPELEGLWSSAHRARRVEELPPPRTRQQALAVMADAHDQVRPIFRTPRPTDQCQTVNTVLFDVTARQVLVYQGREDLLRDAPFAQLPMYQ